MTKKQLEEIQEIADTLGYEEQSMQLIEEMAELTQAINKYRRYFRSNEHYENVVEEIADVKIMLEQIQHLLFIDDKNLDFIIDSKIERTKQRLLKYGKNIKGNADIRMVE